MQNRQPEDRQPYSVSSLVGGLIRAIKNAFIREQQAIQAQPDAPEHHAAPLPNAGEKEELKIQNMTFSQRLKWIFFEETILHTLPEEEKIQYENEIVDMISQEAINVPVYINIINDDGEIVMDYHHPMDLCILEQYWEQHKGPNNTLLHPLYHTPVTLIEHDTNLSRRIEAFVKCQEERAIKLEIERRKHEHENSKQVDQLKRNLEEELKKVEHLKQQQAIAKKRLEKRMEEIHSKAKKLFSAKETLKEQRTKLEQEREKLEREKKAFQKEKQRFSQHIKTKKNEKTSSDDQEDSNISAPSSSSSTSLTNHNHLVSFFIQQTVTTSHYLALQNMQQPALRYLPKLLFFPTRPANDHQNKPVQEEQSNTNASPRPDSGANNSNG